MKTKSKLIAGMSAIILMSSLNTVFASSSNSSLSETMRKHGFKHNSASWTTVSISKDAKGKETSSEARMWIKGDKTRLESKDKDNKKTMVFIDNGKEKFMYTPEEKKAFKWNSQMEAMYGGMMNSNIVVESANQRKTAKKIGSETIDGKTCDILTYKSTVTFMNTTTTSDVKEWLWTKENLPIKSIVKTPKHKMQMGFISVDVPESESTNLVKDIKLDISLEDSLFEIPKGTKIEEMEEVPAMTNPFAAGQTRQATDDKTKKSSATGKSANEEEAPVVPDEVKNLLKGLF